jgi:AcrR family transcriptional regulator
MAIWPSGPLDGWAIWLHPLAVAIASSEPVSRVERRRAGVIAEALEHAIAIMSEHGVGALSISEVARRMGMRGPSLYKYFPSLHALYDALFAHGLLDEQAAFYPDIERLPRGVERIRAAAVGVVRWSVENPALAQLLHWRPVPGFEPSPESFQISVRDMEFAREEFAEAVRLGQLSPAAGTDDALRLYTIVMTGVITQQLANDPGSGYEDGDFSRLTETAIDLFLSAYRP